MIIGLKNWNNPNTYYSQVNNPTEEILRKKNKTKWLESCGPTAAVNILSARGDNIVIRCPGDYRPQPEEVLTDYFNDSENYKALRKARPGLNPRDWLGNEVPQYYSVGVQAVFGVPARYKNSHVWDNIIDCLKINIGVMVCLRKPGHYVGIVAYDDTTEEMIYNDPWPGNKWPVRYAGKSGFNRRMSRVDYSGNVNAYCVEIGV